MANSISTTDVFGRKQPLGPRRGSTPRVATLRAVGDQAGNNLSVSFPCMPETLELSRSNNFESAMIPGYPDGFAVFYSGTQQLKIPFRFKLSAYDLDYCINGPIDLAYMASALHALALPLTVNSITSTGNVMNSSASASRAQESDANFSFKQGGGATGDTFNFGDLYKGPTSVLLTVMMSPGGRGISSVGYLESVSCVLKGPWLNSEDSSYFNLPSSGEFSFTFVQAPSYRNDFQGTQGADVEASDSELPPENSGQGYAEYVRDKLYNTRDLAALQNLTTAKGIPLTGFGQLPAGGFSIQPDTIRAEESLPTSLSDNFIV